MPRRTVTTGDASVQARPPFSIEQLQQGGPEIAVVDDPDVRAVAEDEAFINEMVDIVFVRSRDPSAPKAVELSVMTGGRTGKMGKPNDEYPEGVPGRAGRGGVQVKQTFAYGVKYTVPRYVVEVAARAKTTALRQESNPRDPMDIRHIEESSFFYPFDVVRDPNPMGRAWLQKIMSEPA